MALPVILINATGGSDTQASGAGPSTALFGSTGVTNGTGLDVDLSADAPDLSGVATDGSAVLFMSDTNSGSRNFSKITAVDNGTKIVTVSDAFQASNTDAWAIGGKRASIGSTTSRKLAEKGGSTAGDAMPGWTIRFESGHTESLTSQLLWRRAGNTTDGPIVVEGVAGAATMPVFSYNQNSAMFLVASNYVHMKNFAGKNTNGTKSASYLVSFQAANHGVISNLKVVDATDVPWSGIGITSTSVDNAVIGCEIRNCSGHGINMPGGHVVIRNTYIRDCGVGITKSGSTPLVITDTIIYSCTSHGIVLGAGPTNLAVTFIDRTAIYENGGDGINVAIANLGNYQNLHISNNIIAKNGGYGVNFNGQTAPALNAASTLVYNNCTGTGGTANTSGAYDVDVSVDNQAVDPQFTDPASDNFTIGANLANLGFPTANIGNVASGTRSYVDIGAAQRQATGGGGGGIRLAGHGGLAA